MCEEDETVVGYEKNFFLQSKKQNTKNRTVTITIIAQCDCHGA
jgi:hypothetical protein